jgi:hypothetical protein
MQIQPPTGLPVAVQALVSRRRGECCQLFQRPAHVSGHGRACPHTGGFAEILIGLCKLPVVPSTPRVPSPEAFGRRPVVHAGRFGIGRHPKPFTQTDLREIRTLAS